MRSDLPIPASQLQKGDEVVIFGHTQTVQMINPYEHRMIGPFLHITLTDYGIVRFPHEMVTVSTRDPGATDG